MMGHLKLAAATGIAVITILVRSRRREARRTRQVLPLWVEVPLFFGVGVLVYWVLDWLGFGRLAP